MFIENEEEYLKEEKKELGIKVENKKQVQGIKSSLVLMDDLHEVKGYSSKDRMQNNIDTICR